jgi:hypothetical protein
VETTVPGLVVGDHGRGRFAYIPWDVGALYYRHSAAAHAGLVADVIDHLLPGGRELATNAHPLVEVTVMEQFARGRTLVHLVNGTGHHGTAYFPPVELRDIRIDLRRNVQRARSVGLGRDLPVTANGAYRSFVLPKLEAYDVIVVE